MKITIGIADDHQLFLKSLTILINSFHHFQIILEALNGQVLMEKLSKLSITPDILLIDVNMPIKNGVQTATEVSEKYQ